MSAHPAAVVSVCYSDEATILSCSRDGTVNVWQLMSISPIFTLKASDSMSSTSFWSDMKNIVACCDNGRIHVWNRSGALIRVIQVRQGNTEVARRLSFFSARQTNLAICISAHGVNIWKLRFLLPEGARRARSQQDGNVRTLRGHTDGVVSVGITPDARWVFAGSKDRSLRIWDVSTGEQ